MDTVYEVHYDITTVNGFVMKDRTTSSLSLTDAESVFESWKRDPAFSNLYLVEVQRNVLQRAKESHD